ncbi:unnamed protein product [Candidula unifasciata]|uniref:Nucleoside diphosphate-linked moiety X motif 6 n=1 Tax=Candidula unifasciata TaxID=100452 RepID=A0A8S4A096_9EUPU|nr:unnamed protein product [Candidula unifasciata]
MRLLNPSSALFGKIPAWFASFSCSPWPASFSSVIKPNILSQTLAYKPQLSQKRCIFKSSRKHKCWQRKTCKSETVCQMVSLPFSTSSRWECPPSSPLLGEVDRYQGVWVDLSKTGIDRPNVDELSEEDFDRLLKGTSLEVWKGQGITSVWLHVSMSLGRLLPVASKYGFAFHHAEGGRATLVLWLSAGQESRIPIFATHQVGVSGIVINENTWEVLVVQDKNRPFQIWKFPGGLSELGENIVETAEREVYEETGLKTEFQSVLAFRQHHHMPGAFGRSDLYVLCRLKPLTFELRLCEKEIAACKWMPVQELKSEVNASSLTHKLAELVLYGLKNGFEHVDIIYLEMASLHKGLKFHLFHRPIQ